MSLALALLCPEMPANSDAVDLVEVVLGGEMEGRVLKDGRGEKNSGAG